jgi:hypothetical protein
VRHGQVGIVLPVRSADLPAAVLKVSYPHPGNVHEPAAFAAWSGRGAVRLYRRDDARFALLLERVSTTTLADLPDVDEAVAAAGALAARLAVPAPPGLPRLRDHAVRWAREIGPDSAELGDPLPRRVTDCAAGAFREFGGDQPDTLVHGDLHPPTPAAGPAAPLPVVRVGRRRDPPHPDGAAVRAASGTQGRRCRRLARKPGAGGARTGAAGGGPHRPEETRRSAMVLDLLLIGLAITLEPIPVTAFILLVSAERGLRKGLAFVLAWLACLVLVLTLTVVATGGNPPKEQSTPSTAVLAVKIALGVGLIAYGEHRRRRRGRRPPRPPAWAARLDRVSVWSAAGVAVLVQPWGLVAAGCATVVNADMSQVSSYLALMGFCLLASASLLAMQLYAAFRPRTSQERLARLRTWMDGHQDQAIVAISLLVGLWLVGRSIAQLV